MTFYEAGAGQPLLFLHGIGGGASSWTWIDVAPAFTREFRVIVPDWVGWGHSEHPRILLGFEDYVASLETLLEQIGEPAIIVAQSLACGFAAALAERRPDLVRRFVFHSPSGGATSAKTRSGLWLEWR
jgi:haloalkane dehalogenase